MVKKSKPIAKRHLALPWEKRQGLVKQSAGGANIQKTAKKPVFQHDS